MMDTRRCYRPQLMLRRAKLLGHIPLTAAVAVVVVAAAGCSGSDGAPGSVHVEGARIDYPANPDVAALRMEIVNDSNSDDTLIGVSSPEADASIHRSATSPDGTASMDHLTELPIPSGEAVEFAPGGLHVMLDEPDRALEIGDEVEIVLVFENAGKVRVTAPVVEPGTTAEDLEEEP
ncbi:MAG: copper chaperone PCu(A)C [Acidimicrobiales bacterium]